MPKIVKIPTTKGKPDFVLEFVKGSELGVASRADEWLTQGKPFLLHFKDSRSPSNVFDQTISCPGKPTFVPLSCIMGYVCLLKEEKGGAAFLTALTSGLLSSAKSAITEANVETVIHSGVNSLGAKPVCKALIKSLDRNQREDLSKMLDGRTCTTDYADKTRAMKTFAEESVWAHAENAVCTNDRFLGRDEDDASVASITTQMPCASPPAPTSIGLTDNVADKPAQDARGDQKSADSLPASANQAAPVVDETLHRLKRDANNAIKDCDRNLVLLFANMFTRHLEYFFAVAHQLNTSLFENKLLHYFVNLFAPELRAKAPQVGIVLKQSSGISFDIYDSLYVKPLMPFRKALGLLLNPGRSRVERELKLIGSAWTIADTRELSHPSDGFGLLPAQVSRSIEFPKDSAGAYIPVRQTMQELLRIPGHSELLGLNDPVSNIAADHKQPESKQPLSVSSHSADSKRQVPAASSSTANASPAPTQENAPTSSAKVDWVHSRIEPQVAGKGKRLIANLQIDAVQLWKRQQMTFAIIHFVNNVFLALSPLLAPAVLCYWGQDDIVHLAAHGAILFDDIQLLHVIGLSNPLTKQIHPVVFFFIGDGKSLNVVWFNSSNASLFPHALTSADKDQSRIVEIFFGKNKTLEWANATAAAALPENPTWSDRVECGRLNFGQQGRPLLQLPTMFILIPLFHTIMRCFTVDFQIDVEMLIALGLLDEFEQHLIHCHGIYLCFELSGRSSTPVFAFKGPTMLYLLNNIRDIFTCDGSKTGGKCKHKLLPPKIAKARIRYYEFFHSIVADLVELDVEKARASLYDLPLRLFILGLLSVALAGIASMKPSKRRLIDHSWIDQWFATSFGFTLGACNETTIETTHRGHLKKAKHGSARGGGRGSKHHRAVRTAASMIYGDHFDLKVLLQKTVTSLKDIQDRIARQQRPEQRKQQLLTSLNSDQSSSSTPLNALSSSSSTSTAEFAVPAAPGKQREAKSFEDSSDTEFDGGDSEARESSQGSDDSDSDEDDAQDELFESDSDQEDEEDENEDAEESDSSKGDSKDTTVPSLDDPPMLKPRKKCPKPVLWTDISYSIGAWKAKVGSSLKIYFSRNRMDLMFEVNKCNFSMSVPFDSINQFAAKESKSKIELTFDVLIKPVFTLVHDKKDKAKAKHSKLDSKDQSSDPTGEAFSVTRHSLVVRDEKAVEHWRQVINHNERLKSARVEKMPSKPCEHNTAQYLKNRSETKQYDDQALEFAMQCVFDCRRFKIPLLDATDQAVADMERIFQTTKQAKRRCAGCGCVFCIEEQWKHAFCTISLKPIKVRAAKRGFRGRSRSSSPAPQQRTESKKRSNSKAPRSPGPASEKRARSDAGQPVRRSGRSRSLSADAQRFVSSTLGTTDSTALINMFAPPVVQEPPSSAGSASSSSSSSTTTPMQIDDNNNQNADSEMRSS